MKKFNSVESWHLFIGEHYEMHADFHKIIIGLSMHNLECFWQSDNS